jgi:ATP-dependent DNA helicase DinG
VSDVEQLLGPGGALAQAMPGYEHRPEQLAMARAVALALLDQRALLVEAGTGTGKTLAYLVPAIQSGKRVVVSTGTRHLQEQIFHKDLPLLRELGLDVEAVMLKGISNYVCRRKLAELGDTRDPTLVRITDWVRRTSTGDRAELAGVPDDDPAWAQVTTTPEARLGPGCPYFERCFVTQARRAALRAQLVIVNHHLFFADLALRSAYPGAGVLPPYEAVIFDEAHQIEDVATEHFGLGVSTLRLGALVRDARKSLTVVPPVASGEQLSDARVAAGLVGTLEHAGDRFFELVRARLAAAGAAGDRTALPEDLFSEPGRQQAWFGLDAALEAVAAHAQRRADTAPDGGDVDGERSQEQMAAVARRARSLREQLGEVADDGGASARRHVRWGDVRGRTVMLHASPIDVGPLIHERLIRDVEAAVFASATLTADGSFAYARERLGLDPDLVDELVVDSPFDFAHQALLYLPRDLPLPAEPGFAEAALARAAELCEITQGRAFLLFTSHRSLRHAESVMRGKLSHPLLVQGQAPRAQLLDTFRATPGSVLLATQSFWEGVDVPGEALSLVVIEKLPFAAPDDPLTAARAQRLTEAGVDAFAAYHTPRAAIALKQGFGRLIRRRDDRGIVAILDHRILSRGYGQVFLRSLPPAARTSALEQVKRWWAKVPT